MSNKPQRPVSIMDIRHFREVTIAGKVIMKYTNPQRKPIVQLDFTLPRFPEAERAVAKYTAVHS